MPAPESDRNLGTDIFPPRGPISYLNQIILPVQVSSWNEHTQTELR
jgi:hypothetical protein